jgi:HAE1 family hydrophobic/amphiphilic exporter-1
MTYSRGCGLNWQKIPGIKVYLQNPPAIRIGGSVSKGLYQYTLQSTDIKELYEWAPVIEKRMKDVPGLLDVSTDLQISGPQIFIDIDRKKAGTLGINTRQIQNSLYNAYGSRQISTIYTSTNQFQVMLEVEPWFQDEPVFCQNYM